MKQIKKATIASAFVSAIVVSSGIAIAAAPTPIEQAEIAQLSPSLQAEVKARMANSGQTVSEILDTMLLNSVSKIFASGRVIAADFNKGVVVTEGTNGQLRWFNFDKATSGDEAVALVAQITGSNGRDQGRWCRTQLAFAAGTAG